MASRRPRMKVKPNLGGRSRQGGTASTTKATDSEKTVEKGNEESNTSAEKSESTYTTIKEKKTEIEKTEVVPDGDKEVQPTKGKEVELKDTVPDTNVKEKSEDIEKQSIDEGGKDNAKKTVAPVSSRRRMIKPKVQIGGRRSAATAARSKAAPADDKMMNKVAEPTEEAAVVVIQVHLKSFMLFAFFCTFSHLGNSMF